MRRLTPGSRCLLVLPLMILPPPAGAAEPAATSSVQDVSVQIEPALPLAGEAIRATIAFTSSCFVDAVPFNLPLSRALGVTLVEGCGCLPLPPEAQELAIDYAPLPRPGRYDFLVLAQADPGTCGPAEPAVRLLEKPFEVASRTGVFNVELSPSVPRDDDRIAVAVDRRCLPPHGILVGSVEDADRVISIVEAFPANPLVPCALDDDGIVRETVELGPLAAGSYSLAFPGDDHLSDWIEPFVVLAADRDRVTLRDRFAVEAAWQTADDQGIAFGRNLSDDSAALWFFRPSNVELLVKVLVGCDATGHFWVFAAGLTNQGVALTVTDTVTGAVVAYDSPLGTDFAPILDTRAIPCD